jgi:hypothetical protein
MGKFGDSLTAFIFFFLSVVIISNTAITIYNYHKNNQARDVNYWWSVTCLVFAIIGVLVSGFMFYRSGKANFAAYTASAGSAAVPNAQPMMMAPGAPMMVAA